jgi:hypothetical protein
MGRLRFDPYLYDYELSERSRLMAAVKLNPTVLPHIASITTAMMLARAGVIHFGLWGWVIGPMAGLVASYSLAVAGSKISDIAAKRKPLAYLALGFMLILSPLVIYFSEPNPTAGTVMWAMFPDAAILLASAVTGQSLIAKPAQDTTQVATPNQQVASKKKGKGTQVARKSVKEADLIAFLLANKQASQQQVADHFQVTRSAIGQRIAKLVASGKIKI